jgi:hypothetical protein
MHAEVADESEEDSETAVTSAKNKNKKGKNKDFQVSEKGKRIVTGKYPYAINSTTIASVIMLAVSSLGADTK